MFVKTFHLFLTIDLSQDTNGQHTTPTYSTSPSPMPDHNRENNSTSPSPMPDHNGQSVTSHTSSHSSSSQSNSQSILGALNYCLSMYYY